MELFLSLSLMIGCALADSSDFFDDEQAANRTQTCYFGWSNKGRIIDGKETRAYEYPSTVAILHAITMTLRCGGTILTPWHIITAAHCTHGMSPSDIIAAIGVHNLRKRKRSNFQLNVSAIIQYEMYNPMCPKNDISLLVVEKLIEFSSVIGPACVPKEKIDLVGQSVKALGWGRKELEGELSDVLMEADLVVIPIEECRNLWIGEIEAFLPEESYNFCTNHPASETCKGDSGGPILWLDARSNCYTIVGVISCGSDGRTKLPGLHIDIASYLNWINANIERSKPGTKVCSLQ